MIKLLLNLFGFVSSGFTKNKFFILKIKTKKMNTDTKLNNNNSTTTIIDIKTNEKFIKNCSVIKEGM